MIGCQAHRVPSRRPLQGHHDAIEDAANAVKAWISIPHLQNEMREHDSKRYHTVTARAGAFLLPARFHG